MDQHITPKQKRVLDAIRTYRMYRGYMPSVRNLAKVTKLAVSTVHQHLETLAGNGWIRRSSSVRGIELVQDAIDQANLTSVPVVGTITAGEPIEAIEVR